MLCDRFSSDDGSGRMTATIYEGATRIVELSCTSRSAEDFASLMVRVGSTYTIAVEFFGQGYTEWLVQIGNDD